MRAAGVAALSLWLGRGAALPAAPFWWGRGWQRSGVGPENLQKGRGATRRAQGGGDGFLGPAAVEVEIEEVFPGRIAAWPRLELAQVDAILVEAGEQPIERAGLVGHGANHRGLLPIARALDRRRTRPFRSAPADQEEAGDVLLHGLNPLRQDLEPLQLGGAPPGDRGLVLTTLLLNLLRGPGRVIRRDWFQVFPHDEGLALGQRLRMRQDSRRLAAFRARHRQQAVVN